MECNQRVNQKRTRIQKQQEADSDVKLWSGACPAPIGKGLIKAWIG